MITIRVSTAWIEKNCEGIECLNDKKTAIASAFVFGGLFNFKELQLAVPVDGES